MIAASVERQPEGLVLSSGFTADGQPGEAEHLRFDMTADDFQRQRLA